MLVGHRGIVGKSVAEALPEVIEQGFVKLLDTVFETGMAHVGRGVEIRLERTPGGASEARIVDFTYHPILGSDGRPEGIFVQIIDVTERADAERQQQLLNHELAHRMKNQLALVQAVANLTLRSAADLPAARMSLHQRLTALRRAQDLVLSGTAEATTVQAIVGEVVSLHDDPGDGRFRTGGPDLPVGPRAALSLSLMLHELSTNAGKYGALSVESGSVTLSWRTARTPEGDRFILEWEETGGPPVPPPTHRGSGTRLLNAGVSGARFSRVSLSYLPSGVRCEIRVDMDGLQSLNPTSTAEAMLTNQS
jgi:two-component sensor histidine kinase